MRPDDPPGTLASLPDERTSPTRKLLTALAVAASLTIVACGGGAGINHDDADAIREHAAEIQRDAQRGASDVRSGTKDAEQAARDVQDDMNDLTDETLDAAKDADLPPGA